MFAITKCIIWYKNKCIICTTCCIGIYLGILLLYYLHINYIFVSIKCCLYILSLIWRTLFMTAEIDLSTFTQSVYKRPDVNHVNLYKVDHIFWMESKSRICETFKMLNFKKRYFCNRRYCIFTNVSWWEVILNLIINN